MAVWKGSKMALSTLEKSDNLALLYDLCRYSFLNDGGEAGRFCDLYHSIAVAYRFETQWLLAGRPASLCP